MSNRTSYKKITSLLLIICMLCLHIQYVYAGNEHTDINRLSTLNEEQVLDHIGITNFAEIIETEKVQINREERTKFTVQCEDIINEIIVIENTPNKIKLKIKQDDILDVIEIRNDGKILLDGNLIDTEYDYSTAYISKSNEIMPMAGASIYWRDNVNYGKESDYNHYYSTLNIKDIPLKQAISDITLSGFLTIFGGYLAGLAGAAISFAASSGTTLYNYFQTRDSSTRALSVKGKFYTPKNYTSGYVPSLFTFIWKYDFTAYSQRNYGGVQTPGIAYKCNMQG